METYVFFHPKGLNKIFYGSINKNLVLILTIKDAEAYPEKIAQDCLNINQIGKFWVLPNHCKYEVLNRLKAYYYDY